MVVTGHCDGRDRVDWQAAARVDTLVILMGHARLGEIAERLVQNGRPASTPAAAISRGSLPGERIVTATLEEIGGEGRGAALSGAGRGRRGGAASPRSY